MPRKKNIILSFLIMAVSCLSLYALAPTAVPTPTCRPCSIHGSGYVYDNITKSPIKDVQILIKTDSDASQTRTDEKGLFVLFVPTCGCINGKITLKAQGYQPMTREISAFQKIQKNYYLEPLSSGSLISLKPEKINKTLNNLYFKDGFPESILDYPVDIIKDFSFENELYIQTKGQIITSYEISLSYDSDILILGSFTNNNESEAGIITSVNNTSVSTTKAGEIKISGQRIPGIGPHKEVKLGTILWLAKTYNGSSPIQIQVRSLKNEKGDPIKDYSVKQAKINISSQECKIGDVNGNGTIDIVDALLIAQKYVGILAIKMTPQQAKCWDANCDGNIDIIDSLFIARYYVGMIPKLCE